MAHIFHHQTLMTIQSNTMWMGETSYFAGRCCFFFASLLTVCDSFYLQLFVPMNAFPFLIYTYKPFSVWLNARKFSRSGLWKTEYKKSFVFLVRAWKSNGAGKHSLWAIRNWFSCCLTIIGTRATFCLTQILSFVCYTELLKKNECYSSSHFQTSLNYNAIMNMRLKN